ncbi:cation-transporting P-type ATPase, partial [Acinetobacter baumannii]
SHMAEPFWSKPTDALLASLGSDKGGLSGADAAQRLRLAGPNRLEAGRRLSILRKLGQRLLNPLVAILLFAAAISGFTG